MIITDFLFWLITGLLAIYPARRLVKYWDSRRCLIDYKKTRRQLSISLVDNLSAVSAEGYKRLELS